MFYYSVDSKEKVVHYEGCHHLKNIKSENLKSFDSIRDVRNSSYRLCSCCSPITEHLRKEQSELENYCLENGLLYFVHKGNLHIRTHHSKWKVLASNNKDVLELHHNVVIGHISWISQTELLLWVGAWIFRIYQRAWILQDAKPRTYLYQERTTKERYKTLPWSAKDVSKERTQETNLECH